MEKFKRDVFELKTKFSIEEASGEVDGKHIIGKVKGQFFVPNGESRNKRFYTRELWEKQLKRPEVKERLSNRRMFGTVGHDQPIDEQAILDGKITHIVTDLAVEKDGVPGYGEVILLGTPAGRVLETLFRAGAVLYTSSRADGKYSEGKFQNGLPVVDEDSYELKTFDFVIDPGFLEANPQLAESFKQVIGEADQKGGNTDSKNTKNQNNIKGELGMSENAALLEKSMSEGIRLREDLKDALHEMEKMKNEMAIVGDENAHLKSSQKTLDEYKSLGLPKVIKEQLSKLTAVEKKLAAYEKMGSPEKIEKALTGAVKSLKENKKSVDSKLSKYEAIGTVEQTIKALTGAKKTLTEYKAIGTPTQINQVIEKFKMVVSKFKKEESQKKVTKLAADLNVSEDIIKPMFGKLSEEEIKKTVSGLKEQNKNITKFAKTTINEANSTDANGKPQLTGEERFGKKNRTKRIIESFSRKAE